MRWLAYLPLVLLLGAPALLLLSYFMAGVADPPEDR